MPTVRPASAKKTGWKRWLRPAMLLVAFVFVVLTGIDLARRWEGGRVEVDWRLALAAALPMTASNLLQGVAWILLVERMAHKATPRICAMSLYLDSQLVRYAPGKVGLAIARMAGAERIGLTPGLVGVSVFIEALSWLSTGAIVGLSLLLGIGAPSEGLGALAGPWLLPLLAGALGTGLVLVAVDRRHLPRALLARLGLEGEGPLAPLRLPLVQLFYWLSWLAHGYLLARALGATPSGALTVVGFIPVAAVLGVVAVAAPAGVGVREAALIYGLGPVLGGPGALALAVLSRVQSLVTDVLVWVIARALCRRETQAGTSAHRCVPGWRRP
jgi:hypothetical protein